jgi:hypothetical protein
LCGIGKIGVLGSGLPGEASAALGTVNRAWKDSWAQDADIIAKAAVRAAMLARDGKVEKKVWILAQADVVRLGRSHEPL